MSILVISYDQLAAVHNPDEDGFGDDYPENDPDDNLINDLKMYAMSTTSRADAFLATRGFLATDDGIILCRPSALRDAMMFSCLVTEEYEALERPTDSIWTSMSLSGDDDVDYNGSYLDTAIDLLYRVVPDEYKLPDGVAFTNDEKAAFRKDAWAYTAHWVWQMAHGYEDPKIYLPKETV